MSNSASRRAILKGGLAAAGMGVLGLPEWMLPALAQGEALVPFTDVPDGFGPAALGPTRRVLDIRTVTGPLTGRDDFYTIQHFDQPDLDPDAFRLRVGGLVDRPAELSLGDLRAMGGAELVAGYECSGNGPRMIQGLASNGRWTGVPLRAVLERAGLQDRAREIVFFGADHGEESVDFRGQAHVVDQPFARSMPRGDALAPDPLLAYALNGEPLSRRQGFPLRLVAPGWYGVANVKWLTRRAAARRSTPRPASHRFGAGAVVHLLSGWAGCRAATPSAAASARRQIDAWSRSFTKRPNLGPGRSGRPGCSARRMQRGFRRAPGQALARGRRGGRRRRFAGAA